MPLAWTGDGGEKGSEGLIVAVAELCSKIGIAASCVASSIKNGAPLYAPQDVGSWGTRKRVHRYAHLAAEHLAVFGGNTRVHATA